MTLPTHISLSLFEQAGSLLSNGTAVIKQYADGSSNFIIRPAPGYKLFVGDIMCEIQIDELTILDDGRVITAYIHEGKATILISYTHHYGQVNDQQGSWILTR